MELSRVLSLEGELLDHLAIPENAQRLYELRFNPELLTDEEAVAKTALEFQFSHITKYGTPATKEVLESRFADISFVSPSSEAEWLVDQFRERYARSETEMALVNLAKRIYKDSPEELIDEISNDLNRIRETIRSKKTEVSSSEYRSVLDEYWMSSEKGVSQGVTYGFPAVDQVLKGLKPGELVYVIGRPKRYKSWMLMKSMVEAQKVGKRAVFFTLEMDIPEMYERYVCMASGISWSAFKNRELMPSDMDTMMKRLDTISNSSDIYVIKPPRGQRSVHSLKMIAKEHGADIVYIDQLKFIESTVKVKADMRFREIEYINEDLKDACSDFPFYVAAQFNREAANLAEMADLSKIGLSDSIGQTADVVLGLHQTEDMRKSRVLQLGVIEARSYSAAKWEVVVELSQNSNFRVTGVLS
jgi:replicative DNA helicase